MMRIPADHTAATAFTEAFEKLGDAIFRHCAYRCFDRERAKELMQETFMKAWDYLANGNDIDNAQAFLYKTANNLVVDEARRAKKRQIVSLEDMQEEGFDVAGEDGRDAGKRFDAQQAAEVLRRIDDPYRTALVMRYIDELQPKEIAEVLGETANVVSVRINRGLKLLRRFLSPYDG